jgi:acyl carrier protein
VTEQEIEVKVIEIVSKHFKQDKANIKRETAFTTDLNADSLEQVELLMSFEDEFKTKIPDDQAEKINTVGTAIDYIKANMPKA